MMEGPEEPHMNMNGAFLSGFCAGHWLAITSDDALGVCGIWTPEAKDRGSPLLLNVVN